MKTEIGQLKLRLPSTFAERAPAIGRLVGEALARLARQPDLPRGQLARLGVGPVQVDARDSDRVVAGQIAGAIARSMAAALAAPAREN